MKTILKRWIRKLEKVRNNKGDQVWISFDSDGNAVSERLSDLSHGQLEKHLAFCDEMLYNTDHDRPGRIPLMNAAQESVMKCKAELLARYLENEREYARQDCLSDLRCLIANNGSGDRILVASDIMDSLPEEYSDVPLHLLMRAECKGLGKLDTKPFTLKFVQWCGIGTTDSELRRMKVSKDEYNSKYIFSDTLNGYLGLCQGITLARRDGGILIEDAKTMFSLTKKSYDLLTDNELERLVYGIYPFVDARYASQISKWETLKEQIINHLKK